MVECRICGQDTEQVSLERGLQVGAAAAGQVENGARAVRAAVAFNKGGEEAMKKALNRGWHLEGLGSKATSDGSLISKLAQRKE